jgi:hypothetical protein
MWIFMGFNGMDPRTYPCKELSYDSNVPDNPYWSNPPLTANFDNFVAWKNKDVGASAQIVGDVRWNNFKTADNILAGIEISISDRVIGEYA